MNSTFELASALIAEPSITPDDKNCQKLIIDQLKPLGFECETIVSNGVTNLWARHGNSGPLLVFAGHTDVVPTGPVEKMGLRSVHADSTGRPSLRTWCIRHENLGRCNGHRRQGFHHVAS